MDTEEPKRPESDWTRRARAAKATGSWYADGEQTVALPARSRRRRFLAAFGLSVVVGLMLRVVFDVVTGRHQPFSADEMIGGLIRGSIFGVLAGLFWAYPSVRRKP